MSELWINREIKNWRLRPTFSDFRTLDQFELKPDGFVRSEEPPKLKYLRQKENLHIDLTEGFYTRPLNCRVDDHYISYGTMDMMKRQKELNFLFDWLLKNRILEGPKKPEFLIPHSSTFCKFLALPFLGEEPLRSNFDDSWCFQVVKLNDVIIINKSKLFVAEEIEKNLGQEYLEQELKGGYTGWKLLDVLTEKYSWEKECRRNLDEHKFYRIYKCKMGTEQRNFSVVSMSAVDAFDSDTNQYVEISASAFEDYQFFDNIKYLQLWITSIASDVKKLVIGHKDKKRVLRRVCEYTLDTKDICNLYFREEISWNPEVCLDNIFDIFSFLKQKVIQENVIYEISHIKRQNVIKLRLSQQQQSFMPQWFVDSLKS